MAKKPKNKQKKKKSDDQSGIITVCRNRKARREYEILEELECGIALRGSEVKSIRNSKISIDEAFGRVINNEVWIVNVDIAEYPQATMWNHDPKRQRKLLLNKREIRKFAAAAEQKGLTLIPVAVYFKNGRVKVKLAIGRGRKLHDKRDKLRKASDKGEIRRAMMKTRK